MVEEQAMTNKRQSTLIHQYGSQTQVPVFKYLLNKMLQTERGIVHNMTRFFDGDFFHRD